MAETLIFTLVFKSLWFTVYYLYVMDAERRLTGIVSLRELVTSQPEQIIGEIMTRDRVILKL
ncbi:hypothetical protein [Nostoc favosum]|uniref:CBS domain-containing protein n=1 Tax=Nostoc favosum CHAB5714 TaxID=2780399 RepID=A0ABS8IEC9_9NOSO|nr:hypothetical protein [Nostoc favosum]MCC5602567.1 hypothetical protein [Nostoc favosum CHAB5714]